MGIIADNIRLKRVYEAPGRTDGARILVDRLWPRGMSREQAAIDEWVKDLAPSAPLRKWFAHDPDRWQEFRRRYAQELSRNAEALERLRVLAREGSITLVYAARDQVRNDAVVLREVLLRGRAWPVEANTRQSSS